MAGATPGSAGAWGKEIERRLKRDRAGGNPRLRAGRDGEMLPLEAVGQLEGGRRRSTEDDCLGWPLVKQRRQLFPLRALSLWVQQLQERQQTLTLFLDGTGRQVGALRDGQQTAELELQVVPGAEEISHDPAPGRPRCSARQGPVRVCEVPADGLAQGSRRRGEAMPRMRAQQVPCPVRNAGILESFDCVNQYGESAVRNRSGSEDLPVADRR